MYLIWSAISVTTAYFRAVYLSVTNDEEGSTNEGHCTHELLVEDLPVGCCGTTSDHTFWHQKIHWLLYVVNMPVVIIVVILYWFLVYDPDIDRGFNYFDAINLHTHLFNWCWTSGSLQSRYVCSQWYTQ